MHYAVRIMFEGRRVGGAGGLEVTRDWIHGTPSRIVSSSVQALGLMIVLSTLRGMARSLQARALFSKERIFNFFTSLVGACLSVGRSCCCGGEQMMSVGTWRVVLGGRVRRVEVTNARLTGLKSRVKSEKKTKHAAGRPSVRT